MIILGIDPGSIKTGYAVIEVHSKKDFELKVMGIIDLGRSRKGIEKLTTIISRCTELITTYKPDVMSIEAPFFGKNVQSMLKLGRAQGVAIAAALQAGVPVVEYAPRKIKQIVTGRGNATKTLVSNFLEQLFKQPFDKKIMDSTDALGAAVCHAYCSMDFKTKTPVKDWSSFFAANPDKIKKR